VKKEVTKRTRVVYKRLESALEKTVIWSLWMKSKRLRRKKEMRSADCSGRRTNAIVDENKLDSTRLRMRGMQIEIFLRRSHLVRLSQL